MESKQESGSGMIDLEFIKVYLFGGVFDQEGNLWQAIPAFTEEMDREAFEATVHACLSIAGMSRFQSENMVLPWFGRRIDIGSLAERGVTSEEMDELWRCYRYLRIPRRILDSGGNGLHHVLQTLLHRSRDVTRRARSTYRDECGGYLLEGPPPEKPSEKK